MYMVGKHQAEADRELRQAKIINDLLELLAKNFTGISKEAMHLTEVFKKVNEKTTQVRLAYESREKHDKKIAKGHDKDREFMEWKIKYQDRSKRIEELSLKNRQIEDGKQKDARARNRIETERVHGENVRHNLKMRQLYKDQSQSLSNVMNLMTGMSGKGAAMGGIKTAYNTLSIGSGIIDISGKLKLAKSELEDYEISEADEGTSPQMREMIKMFRAKVTRLTAVQEEMRDKLGMFGGLFGGKGDNESTWAKRLEPIMAWAKKNKTGIIISAASIGLMFMVFKKLLSVSPMLQKMLEVMSLAFNLILRPFGDFIGFILRPIAMGFLMMVMPFFKKAYPLLMELGNTMGNALANWDLKGVIVAALTAIPPLEVLNVLNPFTENTTAGEVGAVGAGLASGGAGLLYGGYRVQKSLMGRMLRGFGVGQSTPSGNAFSKTNIDMGDGRGTTRGRPTSWYKPPKQPANFGKDWLKGKSFTTLDKLGNPAVMTGKSALQITKIARMLAMVSKIARIASPVGLALMGWGGVTSVIKHFDPEMYQAMRDSTEFMGIGREFLGLGEQSDAEQLVGGYNWVKGGLAEWSGQDNSILDPQATFPDNGLNQSGFNGIATPTANGGTHITFNIDKVEKGVDVNMIALQVKAVLETNDRYVTN